MALTTASQLKQRLAELLEIPKKEADNILWAFEQIAIETVNDGNSVKLPGIGTLNCKIQAARMARNPRTGEQVSVPAKVAVKFKVDTSLKGQAPSLKSKKGKALLEQVEKDNKAKLKRKRQREAAAAESTPKKKTKKKSGNSKNGKAKVKNTKKGKATKAKAGRF